VSDNSEQWIARQKKEVRVLIVSLESAYRAGTLTPLMPDRPPAIAGLERLMAMYGNAAGDGQGSSGRQIRPTLFDEVLNRFKVNLRPPMRWFPAADVVITTGRKRAEAITEEPATPIVRHLRIEGPTSEVQVRVDQLIASRRWGIGFTIPNPEADKLVSHVLVDSAVNKLGTGLQDVFRIETIWHPSQGKPVGFVNTPNGTQFEHLMLDILNENQQVAQTARLYEDFMEKTDIRVRVPQLQRRHGARVQVTQISRPQLHIRKLSTIHKVEELVILSPLSLAKEAVESKYPLPFLDECSACRPESIPIAAEAIKAVLLGAIENATKHPLGPMAAVPQELRCLIRDFVNAEAHRSTEELRRREEQARTRVVAPQEALVDLKGDGADGT
jgi:hypothetical protein